MDRYVLSDGRWAKMERHCLGKSDPGRGQDNRPFVEAVLWIARTGSPWRDLLPSFGAWNTIFKRYRDWVKADAFQTAFRCSLGPAGHGVRHGRRHHRQGPSSRPKRQKG